MHSLFAQVRPRRIHCLNRHVCSSAPVSESMCPFALLASPSFHGAEQWPGCSVIKSALNRRSPAGQPRSWPALFTHHPPAMTSRPVCSERALPFLPPLHSSCSRCHRSQTTNLHCALLLASCVFEQTPIACSVCPFLHCTLFEHCHIHRSL